MKIFDYYLKKYGGKLLFQGNLKRQDTPLLDIREPFLREIVQHWTIINFRQKKRDFNSSCIWHFKLKSSEMARNASKTDVNF